MRATSAIPLLLLAGCAAPGSTTKIPVGAVVALAGGDVSSLPPEAWTGPPVEIRNDWFDRTVGVQVDRDGQGSHFFDLTATANGANALEARRSDNQRAEAMVSTFAGLLERGMSLGLAAAGARGMGGVAGPSEGPGPSPALNASAPGPEPAGEASPSGSDPTLRAILEAVQDLQVRVGRSQSGDLTEPVERLEPAEGEE